MKIQMKKIWVNFVGLAAMLAAATAMAEEPPIGPPGAGLDVAASAKILQLSLVDRLERGENEVDVIILLKGHKEYIGRIKADRPAEMKMYQAEIRRNQDRVLNRLSRSDFRPRHQFENVLGFSGTVSGAGLEALSAMAEVESIEEDQIVEAHLAQGIPLMNGSQVRSTYNGAGVSIAIVDTGIDYTHSKLGGAGFPNSKVIGGYDFGDNDTNPLDCQGHGTSVAGIAAGALATGPGDYIGGVAHNAKLYALKIVAGCGNTAYFSTIAAAWNWAVTHRNDNPANPILIINTSFGGGGYTSACDASQPAMAAAANTAVANGITLFTSSGNNGYTNAISAPACVSNSLSVGAVYDANIGSRYWSVCTDLVTAPDRVTCYSNSAGFLDILAPSNDAYTTAVGGGYMPSFGGTSAASPYAAGAGAVLQNYVKSTTGQFLSPANLKTRLINNGNLITDPKNGIAKPRVNVGASAGAGTPCSVPQQLNCGLWVDFANFYCIYYQWHYFIPPYSQPASYPFTVQHGAAFFDYSCDTGDYFGWLQCDNGVVKNYYTDTYTSPGVVTCH
jgi:subtilisin family serine protease